MQYIKKTITALDKQWDKLQLAKLGDNISPDAEDKISEIQSVLLTAIAELKAINK